MRLTQQTAYYLFNRSSRHW